jgi:hypothetical protein
VTSCGFAGGEAWCAEGNYRGVAKIHPVRVPPAPEKDACVPTMTPTTQRRERETVLGIDGIDGGFNPVCASVAAMPGQLGRNRIWRVVTLETRARYRPTQVTRLGPGYRWRALVLFGYHSAPCSHVPRRPECEKYSAIVCLEPVAPIV